MGFFIFGMEREGVYVYVVGGIKRWAVLWKRLCAYKCSSTVE